MGHPLEPEPFTPALGWLMPEPGIWSRRRWSGFGRRLCHIYIHHHCIILQGWVIRTLIGGLPDPRSPEDTFGSL